MTPPSPEAVLSITPNLRRAPNGWLAVSSPGSPLRIGVVGHSKSDAQARFAASLQAWARLRALPSREPGEAE